MMHLEKMLNPRLYTWEFIGLLFAGLTFWSSTYIFLPVLPLYYHQLGMSSLEVGAAVGAYSVGSVLCRFMAGKAADRYGSFPVVAVGVGIAILALAGYLWARTFPEALFVRFLHGCAISVYASAGLLMATLLHDKDMTTEAVGMYTLAIMVGMGFSTSLILPVYDWGDFPAVVVLGIGLLLCCVVFFPRASHKPIGAQNVSSVSFKSIVTNPLILIPTLHLFTVNFCFSSLMTFFPLLMLSQGVEGYGEFYLGYAVFVVLSRFWVIKLMNRYTPHQLVLVLVLCMAVSMSAPLLWNHWLSRLLSGILFGCGYGIAFPVLITLVTWSVDPSHRGMAFGFFTMAVDVGLLVGAIGMGWIASLGGYQGVFTLGAVYLFCYAGLYQFWPRHRRRSAKTS